MSIETCLTNIIGLTQKAAFCYEGTAPTDWAATNASKSGMYVDNLEHGPDLEVKAVSANIHQTLIDSRKEGIDDLITHYELKIGNKTQGSLDSYRDEIGRYKRTNYAYPGTLNSIVGLAIQPNDRYLGINFKINRVGLKLDQAGTFVVRLIDIEDPSVDIDTFSITTTGNTVVFVEPGKSYPLYRNGKRIKYALVYNRGTASPFKISSYCAGCNNNANWFKYKRLITAGFSVDNLDDIKYSYAQNEDTWGLVVDFTFQCTSLDWVCEKDDEFWCRNPFGRVFAKAAQLYADIKLITKILDSGNTTAYTTLKYDSLVYKRKRNRKDVEGLIVTLVSNQLKQINTHCVTCLPAHGQNVRELLI